MESVVKHLSESQHSDLVARKGVALTKPTHEAIVALCKLVKEVDTFTSGFIRIFSLKDSPEILFGEEEDIDTKETIWRVLATLDEGDKLITHRKEHYALMWGSCCAGAFHYKAVWEDS